MNMNEIPQEIRTMRKMRGLTQGELAKKAGTLQNSICRLECGKGNVSFTFLTKILSALGFYLDLDFFPKDE